jgi:hypothetical protein
MTKKILLIIGILAVVGVAVFLIFGSKPASETGENRVGFSIRDYLPFGLGGNDDVGTNGTATSTGNDTSSTGSNTTINQPVPRLRKLSNEPVAGGVIFNIGTTSVVRFVEKGTGNVYEAKSDTVIVERLTNTTIPKIIRSFWLPDGSGFLGQTLESESELIETSFVKLNKNKATTTVEDLTPFSTTIGKLPTGIKEITIKPDGTKIFYYTLNGSYSNWFVSGPDGTGSNMLMSHPLTGWIPKWVTGDIVMMQTKGSSESTDFTYSFDVSKKILKKAGRDIVGISSIPNIDGSLALVSKGGDYPELFVINNKSASTTKITANTLAEKCVWLKTKSPSVYCAIPNQIPKGKYPDVWYKGLVSTEDFIEKMDISNDIFYNIADLTSLSGQKIDVVDMSLSPDETHLIFRNKIDGYLWMLRIAE